MRPPGLPIVAHVLLVEGPDGLILVDTGFGLADIADPSRLGPSRHLIRPVLDPEETAYRQVERLGHRPEDVRDIVVTHFDIDHIGGLADFPEARVHVTAAEATGAVHQPTRRERMRYRSAQWAHGPRLVEHEPTGESWRGFAAARELAEVAPGLVMIALPGHTRGHAAVVVEAGDHWVLHAGDAFYHPRTLERRRPPWQLAAMETTVAFDLGAMRANQRRLADLHDRAEPDLEIVCAHDPSLLERARARP